MVYSNSVETSVAPSRARKLVKAGDVLVSTVRPERGTVGIVGSHQDGSVCTTGLAVLRHNPILAVGVNLDGEIRPVGTLPRNFVNRFVQRVNRNENRTENVLQRSGSHVAVAFRQALEKGFVVNNPWLTPLPSPRRKVLGCRPSRP